MSQKETFREPFLSAVVPQQGQGEKPARSARSSIPRHADSTPVTETPALAKSSVHELPPPQFVILPANIDDDGVTIDRALRRLSHAFSPIYFAFKVAVLVTLPLSILAFTPQTQPYFLAGSIIPVLATTNTRLYCGDQFAQAVQVIQGACWVLVFGTVTSALGVAHHEGAWWGLTIAAIVCIAFFPNLRSKRILMNYTLVVMQLQRTDGGDALYRPAHLAAGQLLAAAFIMFQSVVPFPLLNAKQADRTMQQSWCKVASIARQLRDGVWSGRAVSGYVGSAKSDTDDLAATVDGLPATLFLSMFEPYEGSLPNQLRNVRVSVLRRLLSLLLAALPAAEAATSNLTLGVRDERDAWLARLRAPMDAYLDALADTLARIGQSLDPAATVTACAFDTLQARKDAVVVALMQCRTQLLGDVAINEDVCGARRREGDEPRHARTADGCEAQVALAFHAFQYFHMLLVLIAEELHTFAEDQARFDRRDFKRTRRRFVEFFFLDAWHDVRDELPKRLLLRNAASRRCLKDGIKMACAYSVAAAFTTRLNTDNTLDTYYFGMSILLGIGMPTASESLEIGVFRVAGMAFATAIGYVAAWKTNTYPQALAIVICGTFVATLCRCNERYAQVGWYASSVAPAAYSISSNRITMLSRVVDNSFAVMAYFCVCIGMFPINVFKVLWNKHAIVEKHLADAVALLAATAQLSIEPDHLDIAQSRCRLAEALLNEARRVLTDTRTWVKICEKEPIAVGRKFPRGNVEAFQALLASTHAGLRLWLMAMQMLFRGRVHPVQPHVQQMLSRAALALFHIDAASRAVFQDLIDAVHDPMVWSAPRTLRHFNDFVRLKSELEDVLVGLHSDMAAVCAPAWRARMYAKLTSGELRNRSFVGASIMTALPENLRAAEDYGPDYQPTKVDLENADRQQLLNSAADRVRALRAAHGPGAAPRGTSPKSTVPEEDESHVRAAPRTTPPVHDLHTASEPLCGFTPPAPPPSLTPSSRRSSFADRSTLIDASTLPQTAYTAIEGARPPPLSISYRSPVGTLPVDVDVSALTLLAGAVSTVLASLEAIMPFMNALNAFARSRREVAACDVREFFHCSPRA